MYRKSHVWYTKCFDEPATPDLVTFNASFGVEFGLFTCVGVPCRWYAYLRPHHASTVPAAATTSCSPPQARRSKSKAYATSSQAQPFRSLAPRRTSFGRGSTAPHSSPATCKWAKAVCSSRAQCSPPRCRALVMPLSSHLFPSRFRISNLRSLALPLALGCTRVGCAVGRRRHMTRQTELNDNCSCDHCMSTASKNKRGGNTTATKTAQLQRQRERGGQQVSALGKARGT